MRPPACVRTPRFVTLGPRMPRHALPRWFRGALLLAPCACVGADPLLPGDAQVYDVAAYALRGEYDWDRGRLLATVDVTFSTEDPQLSSILLESLVDVSAVTDPDGNDLPFVADPELGTLQIDITALADQDPLRLTIAYEAASSEALRAWDVRAGDPATTRALYTYAEPLDVPRWMPCQNRPDDRARFSVELRMRNDESLSKLRKRDTIRGRIASIALEFDSLRQIEDFNRATSSCFNVLRAVDKNLVKRNKELLYKGLKIDSLIKLDLFEEEQLRKVEQRINARDKYF